MADHPSVLQQVEIAPETTAGTPVAGAKQLRSMMIEFSPQATIDEFIPSGAKYPSLTALNQEWGAASYDGEPTYQEIIYPLASVVNGATATAGGTSASATAYVWVFNSNTSGLDTPKTFTLTRGDSATARRMAYSLFNSFNLDVSRENSGLNGDIIGQRVATGAALSGTAVALGLTPILPNQYQVFLEDSQAALGTATALTRAFVANISVGPRHTPIWPINSANASFAATVESPAPGLQFTLTLGADTAGFDNLLTTMRAGARKFIRLKATGGSIAGTSNYLYQADFSGEVISAPSLSDLQDLYVAEWTFRGVHDSTWTRAYEFTVVNNVATY